MKKLTFLLLILFSVSAISQPTFQTDITYENPGFDRAYSMCQTADGGFVLAGGMSNADGTSDASIVKYELDNDGNFQYVWKYLYSASTANEVAYEIIETSDGDLLICGRTDAYSTGGSDIFVLKLYENVLGEPTERWSKTYGGPDHDEGTSLVEIFEGDPATGAYKYVIAGKTRNPITEQYELSLMKLNTDGSIDKDLSSNYVGAGIVPIKILTYNGGYALCGGSKLAVLHADGSLDWESDYNFIGEGAYDFDVTDDGGFIITGSANGFPGNADYYLMKINNDANHTLAWTQYYGGETVDLGFSVKQTYDGGYLVSGSLWSFGNWGVDEIGLIKTDQLGDVDWFYIHEDDGIEWGSNLMLLDNGDFVISGSDATLSPQDADFYLVRFTAPYTDFNISSNPVCTDDDVTFSPAFLVNTGSYSWIIEGETDPISTTTLVHSFSIPGSYEVTMNLTFDGTTYSKTRTIDVQDVVADFTASPTLTWEGKSVEFTASSKCGVVDRWDWVFNDNNPITTYSPTFNHSFSGFNGLVDVKLEAYNNSILVDTKEIQDYIKVFCNASGQSSKLWIDSYQFGNTINSSGDDGGYEDYTSTTFSLGQGNEYAIVLTPAQAPGKPLRVDWRVWIDFNQDGIFQEVELAYSANNKKGVVNDIITIPDDAMPGISLMRVAVFENFDNSYGPCTSGFSGEVEDYSFEINKASLPPVVDFDADPTLVEVNDPVTFTDLSYNNPTSWTWTITESEGVVDPINYYTESFDHSFSAVGFYTVTLEAVNEIGTGSKTKVDYIEVQPESTSGGDYCIPQPVNCDGFVKIDYVNINGTLANDNSSINCYDFYPADQFILAPGNTYNIELSPGWDRMRFFWRIWIDLNNDFLFDESELLYAGNNKKGTVFASITVPGDATYNEARMRISMKREKAQTGPCEIGFEGEVEDYSVFSSPPESGIMSIPELENNRIALYPNPVHGDQLTVVMPADGNKTIEIINKHGAVIDKFESGDSRINLNVSGYASGIYFIKVTQANQLEVLKFIKH